jgi:carboxyl-terminal processing protease
MECFTSMNANEPITAVDSGRKVRPAIILTLGIALGLWGGVGFDRVVWLGWPSAKPAADFRLLVQAWNDIERHYVDRAAVQPKPLTYAAIAGMVNALGDTGHSTFLSPAMVKQLKETEHGHLQGIGVEIQMKNGRVIVVAPLDGSPAQRADLRPGDVIVKVNDQDIAGLPVSEVVARITGQPGTTVKLTIQDPHTEHPREVSIQRASINLHSVSWHMLPGTAVAHLRIASFEDRTAKELQAALGQIEQSPTNAIILDLRNNPGGILSEAITAASQFLKGGNVLLVKDAKGRIKPVPVEKGGKATSIPMAVLVNDGSASAAEIVAGALKDADRAPLVGEHTFGTGTVLEEFPLQDGSALLLAIQEWLTPNGHSFWHKGISPNITVPLPPNTDILLPEAERGMTAAQLHASPDTQLLHALAWLNKH